MSTPLVCDGCGATFGYGTEHRCPPIVSSTGTNAVPTPQPEPPAVPLSDEEIEQLRASLRRVVRKGSWDVETETDFRRWFWRLFDTIDHYRTLHAEAVRELSLHQQMTADDYSIEDRLRAELRRIRDEDHGPFDQCRMCGRMDNADRGHDDCRVADIDDLLAAHPIPTEETTS